MKNLNRKRSGKYYRKNEAEVMDLLGLTPTKGSGAGWVEKEDGYNDNIICQLKSTDKNSIKVDLLDVEKLEYHATVEHKLPIFAIQFLKNVSDIDMGTYLLIRPSDLRQVVDFINDPNKPITNNIIINTNGSDASEDTNEEEVISSSYEAKLKWKKEQEKKWKNKKGGRK